MYASDSAAEARMTSAATSPSRPRKEGTRENGVRTRAASPATFGLRVELEIISRSPPGLIPRPEVGGDCRTGRIRQPEYHRPPRFPLRRAALYNSHSGPHTTHEASRPDMPPTVKVAA